MEIMGTVTSRTGTRLSDIVEELERATKVSILRRGRVRLKNTSSLIRIFISIKRIKATRTAV